MTKTSYITVILVTLYFPFANAYTDKLDALLNVKQIWVTKVMDWFKKDFNDGDLHSWLQDNFPGTVDDQTKIRFFDYEWLLNEQ